MGKEAGRPRVQGASLPSPQFTEFQKRLETQHVRSIQRYRGAPPWHSAFLSPVCTSKEQDQRNGSKARTGAGGEADSSEPRRQESLSLQDPTCGLLSRGSHAARSTRISPAPGAPLPWVTRHALHAHQPGTRGSSPVGHAPRSTRISRVPGAPVPWAEHPGLLSSGLSMLLSCFSRVRLCETP